ncbi:MAG: sulfite exporter TauE/SafE family protein [Hyphomicrobiaceae bacterium]|nr:sulfite exporter TauE/SafE family protein [Hyphomicrobiaceae bacterium]
MDWISIAWVTAGLILAGIVKGATGLGYASCALPFLVTSLGLKPAMAIVLLPAMATNVAVALATGHLVETVQRFRALYAAMVPGIAVGIGLLMWISQSMAVKTLGVLIFGYVAWTLLRPTMQVSGALAVRLQVPVGFLNGVLTGLTGSQVMPLFPYMMALELDASRLVQAINFAVLLCSAILAAGLLATGIMTLPLLGFSLLAVLPGLTGVEIGSRLRGRIPSDRFRRLVLWVLLVTGLSMIAR